MRPVNLLPEGERPAAPAQPVKGGAYVVLGVLGALVLATFTYVTTTNQINSRTSDIARAEADVEAANARAAALGPFQQFAQIKETRLASVQQLAQARFDWERLMRELALVLPEGASVTDVTASATGAGDEDAAAVADPATGEVPGAPMANLVGCATDQREVAVMLVRLRQLHRAQDVSLTDSTRTDDSSSGGATASASDGGDGGGGGCGPGSYGFDATVTFAPEAPADSPEESAPGTPARLGGGS